MKLIFGFLRGFAGLVIEIVDNWFVISDEAAERRRRLQKARMEMHETRGR